jgi:hypothetical protein
MQVDADVTTFEPSLHGHWLLNYWSVSSCNISFIPPADAEGRLA